MQSLSFGCFGNKLNETKILRVNGEFLRIKDKICMCPKLRTKFRFHTDSNNVNNL